jgi:hypothetical protein
MRFCQGRESRLAFLGLEFKMKLNLFQTTRCSVALLMALIQVAMSIATRAAAVSVSPVSASSDYNGQIALTITGLANGQTVIVERFADLNGNNTIDASDPMIQSFRVTDGQTASIGGVRNSNVPGDDDGVANGQVHSTISLRLQETGRGIGTYIYRVSPAASGFVPATTAFTVSQPSYPQKVSGRVMSGASGVPYAFVALLNLEGHHKLVTATSSDASGNFTLNAAASPYMLAAFKNGFLFDFQNPPVVTINPGAALTQNITLSAAGTARISGRVVDDSSSAGVPGAQIFVQSSTGLVTMTFSDANGDFTVPVSATANDWELQISDEVTMLQGCLEHQGENVNTSAGSASGVNLRLTKGTSLIYGRFVDQQSRPVGGITVRASQDPVAPYAGNGVTDMDGNYSISAVGGEYYVSPEEESMLALGLVVQGSRVSLSAGQAMRVDFTAGRVTAHLRGRVVDEAGAPVSDIGFNANDYMGNNIFVRTDNNGSFDFALFGGRWRLALGTEEATGRGLIGWGAEIAVTDGNDVIGVTYVVRHVAARINGSLRDSNGKPISNVAIHASAALNAQIYHVDAVTDASGSFQVGVFNASWQISVDCQPLLQRALNCVENQTVTVSGRDATVNFVAQSAVPAVPIRIDTQNLPNGTVGIAYSAQMLASGGTMPHTWSHPPGSAPLPPGLDYASNSGLIQGTPTSSGIYSFAVRAMDASGQTADKVLSITIAPANVTLPSFAQPERLYDGRVRVLLHNVTAGQTYTIEASDDLKTWTKQTTMSALADVLEYTDALAPGSIRRFYRARVGQ